MALKRKPYFYDQTIKRYLLQILAAFSGYMCRTGIQRDGRHHFIDVPVIYGDSAKVTSYIISGSENTLGTVPIMAVYMTALNRAPEHRKTIQHTEKQVVIERAKDPDGNLLVGVPGKRVVIEKYMPNPFYLMFELAIWCSNNNQLYELVEQILTEFDSEMEIQLSNSPADWTSLSWIHLDSDPKFEKAVPDGEVSDPLYIATIGFKALAWIGPPVKKYAATDIRKIIVDIKELTDDCNIDVNDLPDIDQLIIVPTEEQLELHEELSV